MASNSQRLNAHDSTLPRLNLAIDFPSVAKDVSTIAPAQATFGSVCALLTVLRVLVFLFCGDGLPTHVSSGLHCKRRGLRRIRIALRRYINQLTTWVQLEMYGFGHAPMTRLITELLRRSRGRPQNIVGAAAFPDFSIRRTTRKRLQLGSQNSTGSFRSLMCVELLLLDCS